MVLSAPPPDDAQGAGEAGWIERIARLLRLARVRRGVLILVDHAADARLGELVRALLPEHPDLEVYAEPEGVLDAANGSTLMNRVYEGIVHAYPPHTEIDLAPVRSTWFLSPEELPSTLALADSGLTINAQEHARVRSLLALMLVSQGHYAAAEEHLRAARLPRARASARAHPRGLANRRG